MAGSIGGPKLRNFNSDQLTPVGSKAPKAKVMFERASVAVVDSERWSEDLKYSDGSTIKSKRKVQRLCAKLATWF